MHKTPNYNQAIKHMEQRVELCTNAHGTTHPTTQHYITSLNAVRAFQALATDKIVLDCSMTGEKLWYAWRKGNGIPKGHGNDPLTTIIMALEDNSDE